MSPLQGMHGCAGLVTLRGVDPVALSPRPPAPCVMISQRMEGVLPVVQGGPAHLGHRALESEPARAQCTQCLATAATPAKRLCDGRVESCCACLGGMGAALAPWRELTRVASSRGKRLRWDEHQTPRSLLPLTAMLVAHASCPCLFWQAIAGYEAVFRLLWRIKRVEWSLASAWRLHNSAMHLRVGVHHGIQEGSADVGPLDSWFGLMRSVR